MSKTVSEKLTVFCPNISYKTTRNILLNAPLHFIDILKESWHENGLP